jgi:hypothetical protein
MLETYGCAMMSLTQTIQELRDHLMGPLDVRDYGIHSSHFSCGRGSPSAKGSPSAQGSLEGERVRARRGCQDEDPTSGLRGGDLAPSCDCSAVLSLVITMCLFSCFIKSTMRVAISDVFCYSLSPPLLRWQFCLCIFIDCLCY